MQITSICNIIKEKIKNNRRYLIQKLQKNITHKLCISKSNIIADINVTAYIKHNKKLISQNHVNIDFRFDLGR